MKGGKPTCGACKPCEQDCCCLEMVPYPSSFGEKYGCCDCANFWSLNITWNWSGVDQSFTIPSFEALCYLEPASADVSRLPETMPDCLSSRLSAHGGFAQVEVYLQRCPEGKTEDMPDYVSLQQGGLISIHRSDSPGLCLLDHTGDCEPTSCNFALTEAAFVCFVVRAADGYEAARCVICPAGVDEVKPPCSSSSSGSSDSSDTPSSSSGSSDVPSSSSSGTSDVPSSSSSVSSSSSSDVPSSSSSSSSSDTPPPPPPGSSSSSSDGFVITVEFP